MDDYMGTLSAIPTRKPTAIVPTSAKRERGKVKGNKREPRNRTIAISDCTVYASQEDYDSGQVSRTISRNSATRNRQTRDRAIVEQVKHVSAKQEFAERYRSKQPAAQNYEQDA